MGHQTASVLNYSLYFKIECMHHMFLKLEGGSVIHWKLKACWVNNLLSQSNNFQLKFLDPNKGKQDHSVILQHCRKKKVGKRHTSLILLDVKTMENLIHKYYILTFPSCSWFNILPNSYFQMETWIEMSNYRTELLSCTTHASINWQLHLPPKNNQESIYRFFFPLLFSQIRSNILDF